MNLKFLFFALLFPTLLSLSCKRNDPCKREKGIMRSEACNTNDAVAANRLEPAQRLSITFVRAQDLPYQDSVRLDESVVTRIQSALAAVDRAVGNSNCDDLEQILDISWFGYQSLYDVHLNLDSSATWAQAWASW